MAALTPTEVYHGEFAGNKRVHQVTFTPAAASDTITFVAATDGFNKIEGIIGCVLTAGADADLQTLHPSFSGLVVTIVSKNGAGAAATDWTGAAATLTLLVSDEA